MKAVAYPTQIGYDVGNDGQAWGFFMESNHDAERVGRIESEVAILVRRATSISTRLGQLERSAYLLLLQLAEHGPRGVKALADEFRLDISTVSRQTSALESKGLVERSPDPEDGRASYLRITETGRLQLEETRQARYARYSKLLDGWSAADMERFGEMLARFNRTFID